MFSDARTIVQRPVEKHKQNKFLFWVFMKFSGFTFLYKSSRVSWKSCQNFGPKVALGKLFVHFVKKLVISWVRQARPVIFSYQIWSSLTNLHAAETSVIKAFFFIHKLNRKFAYSVSKAWTISFLNRLTHRVSKHMFNSLDYLRTQQHHQSELRWWPPLRFTKLQSLVLKTVLLKETLNQMIRKHDQIVLPS